MCYIRVCIQIPDHSEGPFEVDLQNPRHSTSSLTYILVIQSHTLLALRATEVSAAGGVSVL